MFCSSSSLAWIINWNVDTQKDNFQDLTLCLFSAPLLLYLVLTFTHATYNGQYFSFFFFFLDNFQNIILTWGCLGILPSTSSPYKLKLQVFSSPKHKDKRFKEKKKISLNTLFLDKYKRCRRVNISFISEYTKTQTDVPDFANISLSQIKAWRRWSPSPSPLHPIVQLSLYLWPLLVLKDTCSILSPSR